MSTAEPSLPSVAGTAPHNFRVPAGELIDVTPADWAILQNSVPPADVPMPRARIFREATAIWAQLAVARPGSTAIDDIKVKVSQMLGNLQFYPVPPGQRRVQLRHLFAGYRPSATGLPDVQSQLSSTSARYQTASSSEPRSDRKDI